MEWSCETCKRKTNWKTGYCYYKLEGMNDWLKSGMDCPKYKPYIKTEIGEVTDCKQTNIFELLEGINEKTNQTENG